LLNADRVGRMTGPSRDVQQLVAIIDQAYDHQSWHGRNLRGSIRRLSIDLATWRAAPNRHNIWEIVVHAAYWKYVARRRLTGAARGWFPLKGSNWFQRPQQLADQAWRSDVALLDEMHHALRTVVTRLSASALHRTPPGSRVSNFALLSGVAAHDLYHAGQIQLLKALFFQR
jgi:hypothetical protein